MNAVHIRLCVEVCWIHTSYKFFLKDKRFWIQRPRRRFASRGIIRNGTPIGKQRIKRSYEENECCVCRGLLIVSLGNTFYRRGLLHNVLLLTLFSQQADSNDNETTENQDIELKPLDKYNKSLVVVGESGSGKTALMAKIAEESIKC